MALASGKAKAPCELSISELNSMAFGLAVYASQDGLPRHHARLASGRWSGATGRAFHPQGSNERFQSCSLHLFLLSQAWLGAIPKTHLINQNPINSSKMRRMGQRFQRTAIEHLVANSGTAGLIGLTGESPGAGMNREVQNRLICPLESTDA
jgi:hypothetical protein